MECLSLCDCPGLRLLGRRPASQPTVLRHAASGLECLFTGSELWLTCEAEFDRFEPWLSVELNGAWIARLPLSRGNNRICLVRGMTPGVPKHIRVLKDGQAMSDDPRHCIRLSGMEASDGEFLPLPAPRYRLEFVGDSITSGEGTIGAVQEEDWVPAFFSSVNHYARMTADALGAEYRIFSQSGWGVLSGWDNDPAHALIPYYETVCGFGGDSTPNDFTDWKADAVIINLGTNDEGAMHNPPFPLPDGTTFSHPGPAALEDAAVSFLKTVRRCNPDALLVWAYGMLGGEGTMAALRRAVERFRRETGDQNVHFVELPETTLDTVGARQHPGVENHRQASETLTAFLKEELL